MTIISTLGQNEINEFTACITNSGGYRQFYVGIATDPRQRLFNDHNVDEKGVWIYSDNCGSDTLAREIEKYFLEMGCQGGDGGGDESTKYVYAYKVTSSTREDR